MINDEKLIKEAKKCDNCLEWHKHCNAECCGIVYINVNPERLNESWDYLIIKRLLTKDMQWYYKLRGVKYIHGELRFPKKHCIIHNDRILYLKKCRLLDNNLCKGHPKKKPIFCQSLVLETAKDNIVTPNCLFKYKLMEEEKNE